MKKAFILWALSLLLAGAACSRLEIENIDPDSGSTSGGSETTLTDPELAWSKAACEATIGAENTFPTLSNPYGVEVSYSSSDTSVATIDEKGNITLVAAGSTSIKASSAATDTYAADSDSYALTVLKAGDAITWSANACTVTYGKTDTYQFPTLSNPGGQSITYSSSNKEVATISEDGTVTIVAEGETTITAAAEANSAYEAGSASYTLTVEGTLEKASLSWSADNYTATLASDENVFPTLNNPNNLKVGYSSSDETIAAVDASTGAVTLVAEGTVAIVASSEATDTHAAGSASYTLKVVKQEVSLTWSADSFSVVLEEGSSSYPALSVSPSAIAGSITYASSNTGVATIASDGTVTLTGTGSATISASFAGSDVYKAASASYKLSVTTNADDGAGTYTFASAGDSGSDDDISNTTFTRMVTVAFSSGGASVSGYNAVADVMDVNVSGNQVSVNYTGSENVVYKLTGTASNGCFKLYSTKKQALWLSGVSLTSTTGAAINNQSGKRTFVYVEGNNYLYDSSSAAYSSDSEDMKAVFFSEGQLVFSGSGTLTVEAKNAQSKSAIASDDYVRIMDSPTLNLTSGSSAGHGIRGKEYVQLSGGALAITTNAAMKKGITSEDYVLVEGGTHTITVKGGVAYDSEDSEYKGSAGIKADNYFGMTGGSVTITNSGTGGKGVSAGSYDYVTTNGTAISESYITGGTLKVTTSGSESNDVSSKAIKIGYKEKSGSSYVYGGDFKVSGGSIVASASKSETIETKGSLTVTGGEIYSTSSADDAINSYGNMTISGGYVYTYSSKGDSMDANGNLTLSGGYVFAVTTAGSPEVAIDANTEGGYKLYINSGATVVAYGGLESNYSASQTVYSMSCTAGGWNALHNGSSYIAAFKAPSGCSSVAVSAPSLSKGYTGVSVGGTTYCNGIWASSGISGGNAVSLSTYNGGQGGGGRGGPGGGGRNGGR